MQPLNYLLPQLLVDDIDEAATCDDQVVQLVQVQHGFGHDRKTIDGRSWKTKQRRAYG